MEWEAGLREGDEWGEEADTVLHPPLSTTQLQGAYTLQPPIIFMFKRFSFKMSQQG